MAHFWALIRPLSALGQTMAALLVIPLTFSPFILGEQVPSPVNPTVQALNTNYVLHWTWPGMDRQTANFTVQSIAKFQLRRNHFKWKTACEETSDLYCDLSHLNLLYLGIFTLQVRATVNGHHSNWTQVDFAPAQEADVGPPTILRVSPAGHDLEVSILEPQTSNNTSMKDKIYSLRYRFLYWEQHAHHKRSHRDTPNTIVVLEDLKPWTWYCVSVQSRTIEPNRTSAFTDPVCISTQGGFHWGIFIGTFVSSLFLAVMSVLVILIGCFYIRKTIKTSGTGPAFLYEGWHVSPTLLSSDLLSGQCDALTVISSSQECAHSSETPERQTSSDSQDSGIYTSRKSTSEPLTCLYYSEKPERQTSSDSQDSGIYTSRKSSSEQNTQLQHVTQLSAQDTCLTPKSVQLIQDEGFGDITEESSDSSLQ